MTTQHELLDYLDQLENFICSLDEGSDLHYEVSFIIQDIEITLELEDEDEFESEAGLCIQLAQDILPL